MLLSRSKSPRGRTRRRRRTSSRQPGALGSLLSLIRTCRPTMHMATLKTSAHSSSPQIRPLGRGFLTGKLKPEDLPQGDIRTHHPRFKQEVSETVSHSRTHAEAESPMVNCVHDRPSNTIRRLSTQSRSVASACTFATNSLTHVHLFPLPHKAIAQKKGITSAQLCLAWVSSLGPHVVPLPGSGRAERVKENLGAANVNLSEAEVSEVLEAVEAHGVKGARSPLMTFMWG